MRWVISIVILIWSTCLFGQGGDRILEEHFEDYGQALWSQINTLKISGKMVNANYRAYPLEITMKGEDKTRIEGATEKGRYVMVGNGFDFWMAGRAKDESFGPVEKLITQHALTKGSPIERYRKELTYNGLEVLDNEVYNTFRYSDGAVTLAYYLDKKTNRLKRQKAIIYMGDDMYEVSFTYEKYKSQHGLLMPTAVEIVVGEVYQEWVIDETFIGMGASDTLFENPNSQ